VWIQKRSPKQSNFYVTSGSDSEILPGTPGAP
jgi:hypothetical protein